MRVRHSLWRAASVLATLAPMSLACQKMGAGQPPKTRSALAATSADPNTQKNESISNFSLANTADGRTVAAAGTKIDPAAPANALPDSNSEDQAKSGKILARAGATEADSAKPDAKAAADSTIPLAGSGGPTPLVLDWNRDRMITTAAYDGSHYVNFDIAANGRKEPLEWISPKDRILAMDLNENGFIDDGSELFGDATHIPTTKGHFRIAKHGFEALQQYDLNKDGLLDRHDLAFAKLLLWQDLNQNGISEKSELTRLIQTDVLSLSLDYAEVLPPLRALPKSRSIVGQSATYKTFSGEIYEVADVYFHIVKTFAGQ
jgi:hypothetical protein